MAISILALDASTTGCSVALFQDGEVVFSLRSGKDRSSAENLTLMIEQVVRFSGIAFSDLSAIAVGKGPGSYTGLRIAVSTAKGLAMALDVPLLSYGTLHALCYQLPYVGLEVDLLCPMIDARRMEVFCGFYKAESKEETEPVRAELINELSFDTVLSEQKVLFLGEGSSKCKEVLKHPNALFCERVVKPDAAAALELVWQKWESKRWEDLVTFEPFYLKEYMFASPKAKK